MKKNLLLILSFIGILIAAYLAYTKATSNPLLCGNNAGCNTVQNSEYALFLGIPMGFWGMLYYMALFAFVYIKTENLVFRKLTSLTVLWGFLFSTWLTYLEAFVIEAYCTWCLINYGITILINLVYFFYKPKSTVEYNNDHISGS